MSQDVGLVRPPGTRGITPSRMKLTRRCWWLVVDFNRRSSGALRERIDTINDF